MGALLRRAIRGGKLTLSPPRPRPPRPQVKQSNRDALERHFFEVSDPDHARYGQHLSHDEVQQLVMPEPRSILAALGWLHVRPLRCHLLYRLCGW